MTHSGKIKQLSERGFGFIGRSDGEKDLFFHATGLANKGGFDALAVDDQVSFNIDESGERPRAIDVTKIEG